MTDPARIVRTTDIETSGLPNEDEHAAICELGWIDLDLKTMRFVDPQTMFVDPGHPIPPRIRAIHHIGDKDVAGAVTPAEAVERLLSDLGPDDVLCAHKASFERSLIDAGDRRWICTWKVAIRAWPDFISHGNQPLRYELGVDDEPDFDIASAMPPHRALPDAYVTGFILRRQLAMRPLERLIQVSGEPGFMPRLTFGKHYGERFATVPTGYLEWLVGQVDMDEDVRFTARWHLEKRQRKPSALDAGRSAVEESRHLSEQGDR